MTALTAPISLPLSRYTAPKTASTKVDIRPLEIGIGFDGFV